MMLRKGSSLGHQPVLERVQVPKACIARDLLTGSPAELRRVSKKLTGTIGNRLRELEDLLHSIPDNADTTVSVPTLGELLVRTEHLRVYLVALKEVVTALRRQSPDGELPSVDIEGQLDAFLQWFNKLDKLVERRLNKVTGAAPGVERLASAEALPRREQSDLETIVAETLAEYAPFFKLFEPMETKREEGQEIKQPVLRRRRSHPGKEHTWLELPSVAADPTGQVSSTSSRYAIKAPDGVLAHFQLQDRYVEVLSDTVGRIREHAEQIEESVTRDNEILDRMQPKLERNLESVRTQQGRLQTYVNERVRSICSQWLLVAVAIALWFVAFLAIRMG